MRPARTRAGSARSQARVSVPVVCGLPRTRLRRWDLNRCGVPGRSRTCDPRFRKPVLYPAELRGRVGLRRCSRAPSFAQPCAAVMRRPRHCTPPRDGAAQPRVCVRRPLPPARAANSRVLGYQNRYERFVADHTSAPEAFRRHSRYAYDPRTHMERRTSTPEPHPPVSGFPCPVCASTRVRLATVAQFFFYLRCEDCTHVWSHPERRQMMDRRRLQQNLLDSRAS
jgi:hypothetical protein